MRIHSTPILALVLLSSTNVEQMIRTYDSIDSLEQMFVQALSRLSHPRLEERKRLVRGYQQRGYASALMDVLAINGLSAIVSYVKIRLQIEFSLPHEPIMVNISALPASPPATPNSSNLLPRNKFSIILPSNPNEQVRIGLDIDWSFPADPWSDE